MPIIVSAGESKNYTPAPEGVHQAVCVDVIDLGIIESTFDGKPKKQHKVNVVWQITELRDDGKPFLLFKRYTASVNEKATLRHDLESWRGKAFTRDEEMAFDVESVIGANCLINVQHKTVKDKTYANVVSVMPLLKGMPKIAGAGYVRQSEQAAADQSSDHDDASTNQDAPITVDDIPF